MWTKILSWFDNFLDEIAATALASWLMETLFPSTFSIVAAVTLVVALAVRAIKFVVVSRNQSVDDIQNSDDKNQPIAKVKSIRNFIFSPIMILIGVLVVLPLLIILISELDQSDNEKQSTDYAVLKSVDKDVVIVRANFHTQSKYILNSAIKGCLRVNKDFRPVNIGLTTEPDEILEFSFRCMSKDKITDIIKEEQAIFGMLNPNK